MAMTVWEETVWDSENYILREDMKTKLSAYQLDPLISHLMH
jgi:hypothetical protein